MTRASAVCNCEARGDCRQNRREVLKEARRVKIKPFQSNLNFANTILMSTGNSGDLRLVRCYLEMALPSTRMDFLMSEVNQVCLK